MQGLEALIPIFVVIGVVIFLFSKVKSSGGKDLKLQSEWTSPETVKVSWVDVRRRERTAGNQLGFVILILGGGFIGLLISIPESNPLPFLIILFGSIAGLFMYGKSYTEPNSIIIGKTETRHRGNAFPTAKVTRFEMGTEMALEGGVSTKPFVGQAGQDANQTIIRFWVDDARAHTVTKNNWQSQVNHEIHDALTKALEAVRDAGKQEEHEKNFGKVSNDTGMPDY